MVREAQESTSYGYNPDGSIATSTVDGEETAYDYNSDGTIHSITRPDGKVETFDYDNAGNLTGSVVA